MPLAPEWLQPRFSSRQVARLCNSEVTPADMRNWMSRGYLRIPGVGFGEGGPKDRPSYEWPHIYAILALFLARAKKAGLPLKEASWAFLKRVSDEADKRAKRQQIDPDETYPFYAKIDDVLTDDGPPEFELGRYQGRRIKYCWLIPTSDAGPLPLEIEAVQSSRVDERKQALAHTGAQPIAIGITDIVRTIKGNIDQVGQ